jgi:putative flippase GtrA
MPRLGKFALVGLFGAALQISLLWWLTHRAGLPVHLATPMAVELAVLHNFEWHARFTWQDRRVKGARRTMRRFLRFQTSNGLISLIGNTLVNHVLIERLSFPAVLSALAAISICSLANYIVADRWVYEGLTLVVRSRAARCVRREGARPWRTAVDWVFRDQLRSRARQAYGLRLTARGLGSAAPCESDAAPAIPAGGCDLSTSDNARTRR